MTLQRHNQKVFVFANQGLGDHIVCNGLYRVLAERHEKVYVFVKSVYAKDVKKMLRDNPKISIIIVPTRRNRQVMEFLKKLLRFFRFNVVLLGGHNSDFDQREGSLDECFYSQASVPFERRWQSFFYLRDEVAESSLYRKIVNHNHKYVFIHQDTERGMNIKLDKVNLNEGTIILESSVFTNYSIFDYILILEQAKQIHTIESSFSALIESLSLNDVPKFAHRYARPEGKLGKKYEFQLSSNWTVFE